VSAFWLIAVIAVGILVGVIFRDRLGVRRALLEAVIPAEREIAALEELIDKTDDQEFKKALRSARETLRKAIDARSSTADTVKEVTKTAATQREAISKKIADRVSELHTKLESWRQLAAVSESEPLPEDVTRELGRLGTTVQDLDKQLEENRTSAVEAGIKRIFPDQVVRAITDWLGKIDKLKEQPPKAWPETKLEDALSKVSAAADELRQALTSADTADKLFQVKSKTAGLLRTVQAHLFVRVVDDARKTAKAVTSELNARDPRLYSAAVHAIDVADGALPDQSTAGKLTGADTLVMNLDELREAIRSGLSAAWNDQTEMPGLADGRFRQALDALKKRSKAALAPGDARVLASEAARQQIDDLRKPLEEPPGGPTQWKVELGDPDPADPSVSEAVVVRARVVSLDGGDPPPVTLRWYQEGILADPTAPGTVDHTFTFAQPGPVLVQVTATDNVGGESVAKRIIQVSAVHGRRAIEAAEKDYDRVVRMQNLISAAIIVWAGWFIFIPTFVGTTADFFAAFLWGFSVDIGAAKVLELTANVKALKPTVPTAKQP
jgi:hypothetical protein